MRFVLLFAVCLLIASVFAKPVETEEGARKLFERILNKFLVN
jgi:hypothetical protein